MTRRSEEILSVTVPPGGGPATIGPRRDTETRPAAEGPGRPVSVSQTPPRVSGGYAAAQPLYLDAGWPSVLPLPAGCKQPPPPGFTGKSGADPSAQQHARWAANHPRGNLALRLPDDILGADVDAYGSKEGAQTLADAEARWGQLPPTWRSSARSDGVSGIRLYRVPPGRRWADLGTHVETVWWGHRYVVAWPSVHPQGGQYHWYRPDGSRSEVPPEPAQLPELPAAWVAGLTREPAVRKQPAQAQAGGSRVSAWALTALDREVAAVAAQAEGSRDTQLNTSAYNLGQLVGGGRLAEPEVRRRLTEAALSTGLDASEVAKTIESGLSDGQENPRRWPPEREQPPPDSPDAHAGRVQREVERLLAQQEARRRVFGDERPPVPPLRKLSDFLAEPDEPIAYRVQDLWPAGGNVLLAAQAKSGKSTLRDNLIRSLVDGDDFLGRHKTEPVTGTVVLLDFEMPQAVTRRWLRDQAIDHPDKVVLVSLRGQEAALDLLDPRTVEQWAQVLRDARCEVLVVDCLGPLLSSLGVDENDQLGVGRVLSGLRATAAAAQIAELFVVHHMGHSAERSRGASRLLDWPDAGWRLLRTDEEDPSAPRVFAAYGRDVDSPEIEVVYDEVTRHLVIPPDARSRREIRAQRRDKTIEGEDLERFVAQVVKACKDAGSEGLSKRGLREAVPGDNRAVEEATRVAIDRGLLTTPKIRGFARYVWTAGQGVLLPDEQGSP